MEEGEINRWATMRQNVQYAFDELPGTVKRWVREVDEWKPDVVISDFEPLAGVYARSTRTSLIARRQHQHADRRHDDEIIGAHRQDYLLARAVAHSMVPGAVEYIVTTFFEPPLACWGRTTLAPPIIRPELSPRAGERGEHLVVYSSGDPS